MTDHDAMTDPRQPGAEPTAAEPLGELTPDQQRRVHALRAAREVLQTKTGGPLTNNAYPPETYDVLRVAGFILAGRDPWEDPEPVDHTEGETDE